jgi:hypothetical protein
MLGKVAIERLVEQEKMNKQLTQKSKELKPSFDLPNPRTLNSRRKWLS